MKTARPLTGLPALSILLLSVLTSACAPGTTCPDRTTSFQTQGGALSGVPYAAEGVACLGFDEAVIQFPILGLYEYEHANTLGAPIVELTSAPAATTGLAAGRFQRHGVTAQKMEWGVLFNPDGTPAGRQTDSGAQVYLLYRVLEAGRTECTPGTPCDPNNPRTYDQGVNEWDFAFITMSFIDKKAYVLGERERACPTCAPRSPPPSQPTTK